MISRQGMGSQKAMGSRLFEVWCSILREQVYGMSMEEVALRLTLMQHKAQCNLCRGSLKLIFIPRTSSACLQDQAGLCCNAVARCQHDECADWQGFLCRDCPRCACLIWACYAPSICSSVLHACHRIASSQIWFTEWVVLMLRIPST